MKKYISEFLGTFAMIFCGTGAMIINEVTGGDVTHVGVAMTWGLIVIAMIYAFGDISGAHFNPAVSIAFAFAKRFQWKEVPKYILAQLIGAFLASIILRVLFPASELLGMTVSSFDVSWRAFVLELLLTFFLMLTIINVSTGSKEVGIMAGFAIGGVVLLEAMFAGPMTNASMNPARSIAPAVVVGNLNDLWLYVTAPILGALLAILSCRLVKNDECCNKQC